MADLQKALNDVYAFLKAQGRCSVKIDESGPIRCMYRGPDGAKCAAGFFIPDDKYNPDMEGLRASALLKSHVIFNGLPLDFLDACQRAHDNCFAMADFQGVLRLEFTCVANQFRLTLAE